jgi:pyruvate formate lyase activating enzyme
MNIDLKGFTYHYYNEVLGGDFDMVKEFISEAAESCHVELTTLIVPGENDTDEEMLALTEWVAGLHEGKEIPLHVTRFFPCFHMTDRNATDPGRVRHLAETARQNLKYVYTGNI